METKHFYQIVQYVTMTKMNNYLLGMMATTILFGSTASINFYLQVALTLLLYF